MQRAIGRLLSVCPGVTGVFVVDPKAFGFPRSRAADAQDYARVMVTFSIDGEEVHFRDDDSAQWQWECSCDVFKERRETLGAGYCAHVARALVKYRLRDKPSV